MITAEFEHVAKLQVTQLAHGDVDYWQALSEAEYSAMQPYIGKPRRIMDLGCGLGRMSAFVHSKLADPSIEYIMADSTGCIDKSHGGWNAKAVFYNDLELTGKFVSQQGISRFRLFDLQKHNVSELKNVDLIMSFLSVGFHYPIENYMKDLLKCASPSCCMVFGVRKGKYIVDAFTQYFDQCLLIPGTVESKTSGKTKEDILILKRNGVKS